MEGDNIRSLRWPLNEGFSETLRNFQKNIIRFDRRVQLEIQWNKKAINKLTSLVSSSCGSGSIFCQNWTWMAFGAVSAATQYWSYASGSIKKLYKSVWTLYGCGVGGSHFSGICSYLKPRNIYSTRFRFTSQTPKNYFWKSVNKFTANVCDLSSRWLFNDFTASSAFSEFLYSRNAKPLVFPSSSTG